VHTPTCLSNALVAHFGELRDAPCGHCSRCQAPSGSPPANAAPPEESFASAPTLERAELRALALSHPQALGEARQLARFLCGLTSPATSRARLSRHALFGALAERRFGQVLAFAAAVLEDG